MDITKRLFALADEKYASFQAKLIPTVDRKFFIGVRVPLARKLAKVICNTNEDEKFLSELPHQFFDENILHGIILSASKDYEACIVKLDHFLPYVDNWAVCDIISPKNFKNNKNKLIVKIMEWVSSNKTYTVRFGLEMLMTHFLDEDFRPVYLNIPIKVKLQDYYVKTMIAWFFATALAKQWQDVIPYIANRRLEAWTHNKTIQKACESYRITNRQKEYLKTLKI